MATQNLTTVGGGNRRHLGRVVAPRERATRLKTNFQKDVDTFRTDPQIRSIWAARAATFKLGEPVDSLTLMIKARLDALKGGLAPRI